MISTNCGGLDYGIATINKSTKQSKPTLEPPSKQLAQENKQTQTSTDIMKLTASYLDDYANIINNKQGNYFSQLQLNGNHIQTCLNSCCRINIKHKSINNHINNNKHHTIYSDVFLLLWGVSNKNEFCFHGVPAVLIINNAGKLPLHWHC